MSGTFDHQRGGTPERTWRAQPRLEAAPGLDLGPARRLLVLAAHPDDETLGAGGLIATAGRIGIPVDVLIATDGEASHPASATRTSAELAVLRRGEARAAIAALDPRASVAFLGLPDGALSSHHPQLADAVAERLTSGAVLVTPWRGDRHPDHETCALAAREVLRTRPDCEHWQYPIWAWHWADPGGDALPWVALRVFALDAAARAAKAAALSQYPSQHTALSDRPGDEAVLPPSILEHFQRPFEAFVVEAAHAAGGGEYFAELYARDDDPWGLADRFYERRKRDLLLACLPRQRFDRAFEPGCATGLLTQRLAARCGHVVSWDAAHRAITLANTRLAGVGNVTLTEAAIPTDWPTGRFDLVVLSEVGYYCDDLATLARRARHSLADDGVLVCCHWRHPAPEHPRTAEEVHSALGAGLQRLVTHVEEDFLLDVWSVAGQSVARAEGIVE